MMYKILIARKRKRKMMTTIMKYKIPIAGKRRKMMTTIMMYITQWARKRRRKMRRKTYIYTWYS